MTTENNRTLIEGKIADYYFSDEGILFSYSKNPKRTVELITENAALVKQITANKIVPLLIHLCDSPIPDKETRKFSREQLPNLYKAMAMVSKPGLSKLIMNVLFKFQSPPIPMRSFDNEEEALVWLKKYL